jgi:LEA14-like dessication related protein
MVLIVVPLYAMAQYALHPPSAQQGGSFGNLELQSTSVDVTGLGGNGINLNLQAVIYNPNGFGATIVAANYSVYANGQYVGEGQLAHDYALTPQSSQTLVFPIGIGWRSAFKTTGSYIVDLGTITWKVDGTASIEVAGFPLSLAFEFTTD